jgi:hypothetical protein
LLQHGKHVPEKILQLFLRQDERFGSGSIVIQRPKTTVLLSIGRASLPMPSGLLLCASRSDQNNYVLLRTLVLQSAEVLQTADRLQISND